MKRSLSVLTLLALFGTSGCLKKTTGDPSLLEPDAIFQDSSEIFSGTLSPQGTQFKAFSLTFSASTAITLASLTTSPTNVVSVPMTLMFGTPAADLLSCTASNTQTVTPSLTTHYTQNLVTGTYCVAIADPGNLTGDTNFAIRIRQTLALPGFGTAGTETFSTNLYPGSFTNRTFGVSANGEVKVALAGVSPQASVGLGLGVTNDALSDCYLNKVVVSTPGAAPQLTATAEVGAYCVKVFDPGGLADRVLFNVQITHP